jgi:hypothetical protein
LSVASVGQSFSKISNDVNETYAASLTELLKNHNGYVKIHLRIQVKAPLLIIHGERTILHSSESQACSSELVELFQTENLK